MLTESALRYYRDDAACPISWEPSGEDFLSPCLAEADLMRRILPPRQFASWLGRFLPQIPADGGASWLPIGVVTDRADGKLAHLDGLNLSRAWMLEGIASALPAADPRRAPLLEILLDGDGALLIGADGDALAAVLRTCDELSTGRLAVVFGCGGDRDKTKRPLIGGIATRLSDLAILTTDNPRT